uniref:F-BAR domain-containing protein n=1 Tax=Panagrolaimus superbus TaxID=310955 RepID=A0A914YGR4_9BILA
MLVDYSEHFWGEKHIGYNTLYENLKRGEDSVQELSSFVKDRISLEEDIFKSLNKSLIKVNQYVNNNGAFVDSWRLTKGTIELYCDIQASVLKNLIDLSKDVIKYHDDLVKSRKRVKVQDVVDAVNLMQTTTTCLQKAKETYQQRCAELLTMKNETQSKEVLKMKSKVAKAHEEYKSYVEKYAQVRDNFEEKMLKSSKSFQAHDTAHLQQMKTFFTQFGRSLDDAQGSIAQVTGDYRNSLQQIDIENIMVRFVEEKGTGTDKPEPIKWTESDELLDDISHITSSSQPSSSNSSAIVTNSAANLHQNVTNFIDLDSPSWTPTASTLEINKTGDSDIGDPSNIGASSNLTQFSSSLGRQKLSQWLPRRKKNSSQSSLSGTTEDSMAASTFGESNKGGFLKRYRKVKNSINDLTAMTENNKEMLNVDDNKSTASSAKSDEKVSCFFFSETLAHFWRN